jgi:hypothetical protein
MSDIAFFSGALENMPQIFEAFIFYTAIYNFTNKLLTRLMCDPFTVAPQVTLSVPH